MTAFLKHYLAVALALVVLDIAWLAATMTRFYDGQLGALARRGPDGRLAGHIAPGLMVYLLLPLGITLFVLPAVLKSRRELWRGAALGLVVYGTYDFTNLSLLKDWPVAMTLVDTIWGMVLCTLTAWIAASIFTRGRAAR